MPTASTRARRARARRRRGNIAVLSALMLTMLLGFAALAVDVSNKYRVRAESQSAVDAAALAGAWALNGTAAGLVNAAEAARNIGQQQHVYTDNATVAAGDVQLGSWNPATRTFTPVVNPNLTNAVRVRHQEPAVAHPFAAPLTGTTSSAVGATAIACASGPSTVNCAFPLAIGSCTVRGDAGLNCGGCLQLGVSTSDNVGWSTFGKNPNTQGVSDALRAACFANGMPQLDSEGRCTPRCASPPVVGRDTMELGNGNNFTKKTDEFCGMMKTLLQTSPTGTIRTEIPVFDSSGSPCNPGFSTSAGVTGFASVEITAVKCGNGDKALGTPPPGCNPPADKYIVARVLCNTRTNLPGGGPPYGTLAMPVLVD